MSGDPEQDYFADGMVEDIITALSRFKSLFVIARNSSFTYKGKAVDIKQVGRDLGVRYVLEGSIRRAGSTLRITGQLIEAATNNHLWADRFDGAVEDMFDLQDQVASRVVNAVAPSVENAEQARSRLKATDNLDAYDCFLRGREGSRSFTIQGTAEALGYFRRAIALDPTFGRAYGRAAMCLFTRRTYGWSGDAQQELAEGKILSEQAIAFGQADAEALSPAANFLAFMSHELERGGDVIDRALTLNPNFADGWRVRGLINVLLGHADLAVGQLETARRLCPIGPELFSIYTASGQSYLYSGHPREALPWFRKALVLQPNWMGALRHSIVALVAVGNLEGARRTMQHLLKVAPDMNISVARRVLPFRRTEDMEFVVNAFRAAGMPE